MLICNMEVNLLLDIPEYLREHQKSVLCLHKALLFIVFRRLETRHFFRRDRLEMVMVAKKRVGLGVG